MFNKWFIVLLIVAPINTIINGLPFNYERIVIADGNTIIKTVDLISDWHVPVHEFVKKPSRKRKRYLAVDEQSAFTTSERTLLITLRKLAAQKNPIELLWEEPVGRSDSNLLSDPVSFNWLVYSLRLKKEFAPSNHASVVYNNGDTYRNGAPNIDLTHLMLMRGVVLPDKILDISAQRYLAIIAQLADPKTSKAEQDLENVKKNGFKQYYGALRRLWNMCMQGTIMPFYRYVDEIIDRDRSRSMTLREFRDIIRTECRQTELDTLLWEFMEKVADMEFLIKLFASPSNHTIVYAGGTHCANVKKILVNQFAGKELVSLGTANDSVVFNIQGRGIALYPILIARTWTYLAEDPSKTFRRFKSRGRPIINLASDELWNEFITLFTTLEDLGFSRSERIDEDQKIKEELVNFYAKASKTFIDFINVRDEVRKTLLYYAVEKNLVETTDFLLQHNARVNIQDLDLNTPLHYAEQYAIPKIIDLLLAHGARTDIKNFNDKTSIEQAEDRDNDVFVLSAMHYNKTKKARSH